MGIEAVSTWLDRAVGYVAPQAGLRRMRARFATEVLARHFEAASIGRRTSGWRSSPGDANAVGGPDLIRLREIARDLVRNNGYAESALTTICDHVVGWGIVGKPATTNKRAAAAWKAWAESTDCDSDGRHNFAGLQHLAMRTVAESGEVLIRRRIRRPEDGLAIPMQIQVIDPDYLDVLKLGTTEVTNAKGERIGTNRIIHGVEFDFLGRRTAYWLFREHPGTVLPGASNLQSYRVPAESVVHVFRQDRPGQVRGISWFAPVLLKFKDFDEYEDATLMKQKIAACLAVFTSDTDGNAPALGTIDAANPALDSIEPGLIANLPPGRTVTVLEPPSVREYPDYTKTTLRAIATGLGVSYEDLTGDYAGMPFSAARMSRIRHWARVDSWRWHTLIPQFCEPVWDWAMAAAGVMGQTEGATEVDSEWTAPPPPLIDPANEGLAYQRRIRSGLMSQSEALRELGYDPTTVLAEIAADNKMLDKLGIVLDSDPRNTTQAGNPRQTQAGGNVSTFQEPEPEPEPEEPAVPAAPPVSDEEEDDEP